MRTAPEAVRRREAVLRTAPLGPKPARADGVYNRKRRLRTSSQLPLAFAPAGLPVEWHPLPRLLALAAPPTA